MTGPDHYREAEQLLLSCQLLPANAAECATYPDREDGTDSCFNALRAAQVHATLALAAAVGSFGGDSYGFGQPNLSEWHRVTAPTAPAFPDDGQAL